MLIPRSSVITARERAIRRLIVGLKAEGRKVRVLGRKSRGGHSSSSG